MITLRAVVGRALRRLGWRLRGWGLRALRLSLRSWWCCRFIPTFVPPMVMIAAVAAWLLIVWSGRLRCWGLRSFWLGALLILLPVGALVVAIVIVIAAYFRLTVMPSRLAISTYFGLTVIFTGLTVAAYLRHTMISARNRLRTTLFTPLVLTSIISVPVFLLAVMTRLLIRIVLSLLLGDLEAVVRLGERSHGRQGQRKGQ